MIQIKVKGTKAILDAMAALPRRIDRKLLEQSLLVGAVITRDEARSRVPTLQKEYQYPSGTVKPVGRRAGTLRRAIRAGRVRPEGSAAKVWVRVRRLTSRQVSAFKRKNKVSAALNPNDPFYWRFVEFGTSKMAARPFMRPAFEGTKFAAVRAIITDAGPRVQAEVAKLGATARFKNQVQRWL